MLMNTFKMSFHKITKAKWLTYFIMAMCFHVWCASSIPTVNDLSENGLSRIEVPRRSIRSPQLFNIPGKNPLTDLTQQLKPPTINDLNDLRQKMANFANFTALLEQALAAEKAARSNLQNFVTTLKDQVTGITTAVNPDPENYWLESKDCGGIIVSQTGRISYKVKEHHNDNERCIWTIRANFRSKIRVAFAKGELEDNHDYVAVTELFEKKGVYGAEWTTKRLKPGQTSIFEGPLVFIAFISDGTIRKTGFQLDFEGMGSNINPRTMYQHFHFTDWTGQFHSSNLSEKMEKGGKSLNEFDNLRSTIVVNPSYWNSSKLMVSIPKNMLTLRPDDCNVTNLVVSNDFSVKPYGTSDMCCAGTCEKNDYETSNRIVLAMLSSTNLNERSQFQINWSTSTSVPYVISENSCGGILKGDSGKISYKVDVPYANNERCIWIIQPEKMQKSEIKVQLLKDGFEYKYDFVTVAYFKDENTPLESQFLYKSDAPVVIPASFAFIKFYSDAFTAGASGFEMIWEFKDALGQLPEFEFDYTTEEISSKVLSCSQQAVQPTLITVINPQSTEVTPLVLSSDSVNLEVFTGSKGNFTKSLDTGKYLSEDGSMIILHKCQSGESGESIAWEKGALLSPTNTDNQTFVMSEDQCGEVLYGDSGKISYKRGQAYKNQERCTWIIRAKSSSMISIQLTTDGFESCCDKVLINRINTADGTTDSNQVTINRENRFQTLEGPILLVTFFSDYSVTGTGFQLEFHTKEGKINDADKSLTLSHSYYLLDSQTTPDPVVIQPQEHSIVMNTYHFNESWENGTMMLQMDGLTTGECNKGPIQLYYMGGVPEYQLTQRYPNESMCANAFESATGETVSSKDEFKLSGLGAILVTGKSELGYRNKSISISFSS